MVAAAPKKGSLKPSVAVACLSAVVLLFAFLVFFAGKVKYHEWIPLEKSPEVLAERADSILKKLGYTKASVDTDYGFDEKPDYYDYAETENAPNRWERIRTGQPAIIYFWHRTSPRYLEPLQSETVLPDDPSNDVAGMTKIILDTRGRLLELNVVPPQVIDKTTAQTGEVDWTILFTEAGLDIGNYRQTESNWTPPVFADANFSWEGAHIDHAEIPVRIEAAAFQGKPVYFQIVAPWDKPVRQEETVCDRAGQSRRCAFNYAFSERRCRRSFSCTAQLAARAQRYERRVQNHDFRFSDVAGGESADRRSYSEFSHRNSAAYQNGGNRAF